MSAPALSPAQTPAPDRPFADPAASARPAVPACARPAVPARTPDPAGRAPAPTPVPNHPGGHHGKP